MAHKFDNYKAFFGFDYGQLEIRVLAHMSNDKRLIEIFNSGDDIHAQVGHDLTGQPVEKIKNDRPMRTKIKTVHFALVYGKKPAGIHSQIVAALAAEGITSGMTVGEIEEIYDGYFEKYLGAKRLIDSLIEFADQNHAARNMFGFEREINKQGDGRGTSWRNQAVNSPIQSGAHFLSVMGMALVHLKPDTFHYFKNLVMEIHDAFYGIIKVKHLPRAYEEGKYLMETLVPEYVEKWFGFKLRVPLEVDGKAGFRLGCMVDYKGEDTETFIEAWRKKNEEVEGKIKKSIEKLRV